MTQEEAFDILKLGYNVFLTGPPGSGKTFLLNKYIGYLKKHCKGVAVTASTGIAATHMNGTTIHSWTGLGIKERLTKEDMRKLLKRSYLRKRFRNTNVLIIDEISMLHDFQFDLINQICRVFRNSARPFGGMQVVCSGDFFQLPPVAKMGQARFVVDSDIWSKMNLKVCYLKEQHRQEGSALLELLNCIRSNQLERSQALLSAKVSQEIKFSIEPVKLYTHNIDVDAINNFELEKIDQKKIVYRMSAHGPKRIAAVLQKSCLAPERLALKKGAKVMFIKNNFEQGYVNGTLGQVIGFDERPLPIVRTFRGQRIMVQPATWQIEEDGFIRAQVSQLPLRLAWAITVHKSQGMNLDAIEMDLSKSFVPGMGYVALSRARTLGGIKLLGFNQTALLVNRQVLSLDKDLERLSEQTAGALNKISPEQKHNQQRQFLNSLPYVSPQKKRPKDTISTYQKTRKLVLQKMPLKKIAKHRHLTEETIINHLEKLAIDKKIDFTYLHPRQDRFNQIKAAFAQTDDTRLAPVKEILGPDFSYKEIKLARLFLDV